MTNLNGIIYKNEKGFTIIEILGVIAILSALLALAYPAVINTTVDYKIEVVANQMARDISRAKMYSMMSNYPVRVIFEENSRGEQSYYLWSLNYDLEKEKPYHLSKDIRMSSNFPPFVMGGKYVSFNQYGRPSRGGTVEIKNDYGKKLYVIVASVSGRVRVSSFPPSGNY